MLAYESGLVTPGRSGRARTRSRLLLEEERGPRITRRRAISQDRHPRPTTDGGSGGVLHRQRTRPHGASHHGLHRTDHPQPRQRRAHRVPADCCRHRRRAARVRAGARGRRPRPRRARAPRAGGALPRARGHDEVPARPAHDRRRGRRHRRGPGRPRAQVRQRGRRPGPGPRGGRAGARHGGPAVTTAELAHEGNVLRLGHAASRCTWRCSSSASAARSARRSRPPGSCTR